jgi:hypothetical protein
MVVYMRHRLLDYQSQCLPNQLESETIYYVCHLPVKYLQLARYRHVLNYNTLFCSGPRDQPTSQELELDEQVIDQIDQAQIHQHAH